MRNYRMPSSCPSTTRTKICGARPRRPSGTFTSTTWTKPIGSTRPTTTRTPWWKICATYFWISTPRRPSIWGSSTKIPKSLRDFTRAGRGTSWRERPSADSSKLDSATITSRNLPTKLAPLLLLLWAVRIVCVWPVTPDWRISTLVYNSNLKKCVEERWGYLVSIGMAYNREMSCQVERDDGRFPGREGNGTFPAVESGGHDLRPFKVPGFLVPSRLVILSPQKGVSP